ncbi:MAG: hypothetical protein OK456_03995 [Thaumarchaeota archaeon]|nr:hypothetical protein [Nitrososphaerota archaeon]
MAERSFSVRSLATIVAVNAVLLILIAWVLGDYAYRDSYWRSMGFTPSTSYSPFFLVTSAVRGSTYIQGQLTLDWSQVLGAVLVVFDVLFVLGYLRRRREPSIATAEPSQSLAPATSEKPTSQ